MMRIRNIAAIVCLLSLTVTAAGCVGVTAPPASATPSVPTASETSGSPIQSPDPSEPPGGGQNNTAEDFRMLLKAAGYEKVALAELRRILPGLSAEDAAKLILEFEAYQSAAVESGTIVGDELVRLIHAAGPDVCNEKTLNDLSAIRDDDLRKALTEVFDRGYKITVPEGMVQAVTDYGAYRDLKKYLPPDVAAYIDIKATESDGRAAEDGSLIITVDEVLKRALACESFIAAYPESVRLDVVEALYGWYVDAYFFGLNNSPAFEYETNRLSEEFLDSYRNTSQAAAGDELMKASAEYLKVLQENGYILTPEVADYRKSLTNQLKNTTAFGG